jgi:RNA polymerase sigma factor (sigma-70 family)
MTETQALLADYAKSRSEPAFRELVTRYLDLVHSTAVRLVDDDSHRAEDVVQIVFTDLARMAGKLSEQSMLGGWLHRHTCFVARTVMRGERRRQARERRAVEMNALNDPKDSILTQIAPLLDEAINELGSDDRDVILLRFFERHNLRSIGDALGVTENVAQKRVARAVQELGLLLRRRGVALTATALASGLAAGAVTAAPAGLATSIAASVLAGAGATSGLTLASTELAAASKLKAALVSALVIAGLATTVLLRHQSRAPSPEPNPLNQPQSTRPETANLDRSNSTVPNPALGSSNNLALGAAGLRSKPDQTPEPDHAVREPAARAVPAPDKVTPEWPASRLQRFFGIQGSRLIIAGTSTFQDWQVESPVIGGTIDLGPGFAIEPGQPEEPVTIEAQAEVFVTVRSLKSKAKDGRPYSDAMDDLMWQALKSTQYPRISYHLTALSRIRATNADNVVRYECLSQGELTIAGVTNSITMPVVVQPIYPQGQGIRISGNISLKMTSFQIQPPAAKISQGRIHVGDDVNISFQWVVSSRRGQ